METYNLICILLATTAMTPQQRAISCYGTNDVQLCKEVTPHGYMKSHSAEGNMRHVTLLSGT